MSTPRLLDHVVVAGPDLGELVTWFAERTGVVAVPGGAHPTGTANALVALTVDGRRGPWYVELIGPDPAAGGPPPTRFGIDRLTGPAVVTYAVHPPALEDALRRAHEAGHDLGASSDLSRTTTDGTVLRWRIAGTEGRPGVPFLIDWADTPHPGLSDLPTLELVALELVVPDPEPVREVLRALGLVEDDTATLVRGTSAGFRLTVTGTDGQVVVV